MSRRSNLVNVLPLNANTTSTLARNRPGHDVQRFTIDDLTYEDDRLTNELGLDGTITVELSSDPVWKCHYTGRLHNTKDCLIDAILSFRRRAHLVRQVAFQPFGPRELIEEAFIYRSTTSGDMSDFTSQENIFFMDKRRLYLQAFGRTLV